MIAFDTIFLIRHLVQDEPGQSKIVEDIIAKEILQGRSILLLDMVICETIWVLKSAYRASKNDLLTALNGILGESCFQLETQNKYGLQFAFLRKGKPTSQTICWLRNAGSSIEPW